MLALYHYPSSPCAGKVRAVLAAKDIAYDSRWVNILEKENLRPEYLKLNPKGVVPVLVDGDHVMTESTIIMEYLDTAYARDSLKPSDPYDQARMRKWTKWVDESLHANWAGLGWTILIRPDWLKKSKDEAHALLAKLIDPARRERQTRLYEQGFTSPEFLASLKVLVKTLDDMEDALAGSPWLVGDSLTMADLAVLPYVLSAQKFGLGALIDERPGVTRWIEAIAAMPMYQACMPWTIPAELQADVRQQSQPIIDTLRQASLKAA
jgi:glutathione S-transferase